MKPAQENALNPGVLTGLEQTERWYEARHWTLFDFQRTAWRAWHQGKSGLIHSPTGSGKTLAAWLGPIQAVLDEHNQQATTGHPLSVLWITPLRALAHDTTEHLQAAADALGANIHVELRTGDTPAHQRQRQRQQPPFALVTTPESLSVLLSHKGGDVLLSGVHTVIVDEWHELLGSKRGVQLQLCLARLRKLCSALRTWGVSATLGNTYHAMQVLLGPSGRGTLVRGVIPKAVQIGSLLPSGEARFKWSGHLGLTLLDEVVEAVDQAGSTLLFTNTRSQAEIWFQALLEKRPDWLDTLALHHGSLDRDLRRQIERRLAAGELGCVVCTSSLDLGVDFSPVDQVLQVGSPKGIARLLQRAGRSGHQPGAVSRILCVPTQAMELVEIAAVREAQREGYIEAREAPRRALDVLCQHLVTIALGSGFRADNMLAEVRDTHAFAELTDAEWQAVLDFVTRGGQALHGYPQYHKVVNVVGVHRVMNEQIAQRHRMAIGTIASDSQISISLKGRGSLGSTEESFIARLAPGDHFQFAGRTLELVRVKETRAEVVLAKAKRSAIVPRWWGTQLPISGELSRAVLDVLQRWKTQQEDTPSISTELGAIGDTLTLQSLWSHLPGPNDFLIEYIKTPDGYSLCCFPFAGRLAHEGLAMLVATRIAREQAITFTLQINDYGFELHSETDWQPALDVLRPMFSVNALLDDILNAINTTEIAKRRFRDIARIAGLVFDGYPGRPRSARQVQASSGLIFDVLSIHDADNLLLDQARREVLEQQLDYRRLASALTALDDREWLFTRPERLTPLAFPLWAESLQSQTLSSESTQARLERMLATLEAAAAESLA